MVIDNALYLWDYTHPNPELIGYEELTHMINGVTLVKPRAGVFVNEITHLLVVTTPADLHLIGVAATKNAAGTAKTRSSKRPSNGASSSRERSSGSKRYTTEICGWWRKRGNSGRRSICSGAGAG